MKITSFLACITGTIVLALLALLAIGCGSVESTDPVTSGSGGTESVLRGTTDVGAAAGTGGAAAGTGGAAAGTGGAAAGTGAGGATAADLCTKIRQTDPGAICNEPTGYVGCTSAGQCASNYCCFPIDSNGGADVSGGRLSRQCVPAGIQELINDGSYPMTVTIAGWSGTACQPDSGLPH